MFGTAKVLAISLSFVGINNGEDSDGGIGETGIEVLLVLGPDEGSATDRCWDLWGLSGSLLLLNWSGDFLLDFVFIDEFSAWEVIDLDTFLGTNDEPVKLGGEEDNVDGRFSINLIKMSTLNKVPDVDLTVSTTGGDEVGVWCEIKSVDLSLMSDESVHKSHNGVIPNLDGLVPGGRDDDWGLEILEISDAGNPVSVLVGINGEFALTVDVPDLDLLVHGTGGNLSVIWGESNGQNILGVTNKGGSGGGRLEVPESDGTIPGGGESESGILGEIEVGDEMGVSLHDLSWLSPSLLFVGVSSWCNIPDDERFISRSSDKEFLVDVLGDFLLTDLHAGNPTIVTLKVTGELQLVLWSFLFSHQAQINTLDLTP